MTGPAPIRIPIDSIDTIALLKHSISRHQEMSTGQTSYGRSTLQAQDVGLLGEYAAEHWLRSRHPNVVPIADTEAGRFQGDIALRDPADTSGHGDSITFEVKTSRDRDWRRYERTLDFAQLQRSQAHAYIWCVVDDDWPTSSVTLMGWLPTNDIRRPDAGKHVTEHGRPHWRVTAQLQPMAALDGWCGTFVLAPF